MTTAARQHPDAGFVNGQAIYALVKYGREREAAELAGACRAEEWWCEMLIGHVLHAQGRLDEAGSVFRNAVAAAPEEVRCRALDASRLLGRWLGTNPGPGSAVWQRIRDEPCEDKIARSVSLWWLADPLYSTAGNDRWVEHVNRMLLLRLFNDAEGHIRGRAVDRRRYGDHYWSDWLRRGWPDSYVHPGNAWFTSVRAARYHFVPDLEDGDTERPVWRLRAELDDEGYTPRYGTFHELPTQIARFRRTEANPDSMRVAVAGTLSGTEMAGATAEPHLVFSDAPESFPLHLTGEIANDRAAFLTSSPADRYVLSFEVLGDEQFARHRVMLEPLRTEGVGVSDVLLYRPDGGEPPEALEAAADVMLGEAAIGSGEAFGVYWETYGAAEGTSVDIEVDIEGASRGFFSRLRGLLPGGGDDGAVRLAWSEPSPGEVFPRGVVLDPGELEAGGYMLVVRVSWEGREPFELRRGFEVR